MYLRPIFLFWIVFYFTSQALARPPKRSDPTDHLRSLQSILRKDGKRLKRKQKKKLQTRKQRRAQERALKQTLLQRNRRKILRFSRKDRAFLRQPSRQISLGFRLRLFRVGIQREYWSRRMLGEIWLLSRKQPPRLLGFGALQRRQVRLLWNQAQKQLNLPNIGPYRPHHIKKLRRYLEQQGVEVIFHSFSRPSERKKP